MKQTPPLHTAKFYWIALALFVKGLFFIWYLTYPRPVYVRHAVPGAWMPSDGDAMSYIEPVESFLRHQGFVTDCRMPGYAALYGLFRLFLPMADACNALTLLHLVVSAISVYVLALCGLLLFRTLRAFYLIYFVYLFSTFVSVFDGWVLTESLAASASVFFLYAWLRFEEKPNRWRHLLVAGCWLGWSVFLKPAHLPMLAIPVGIWGYRWVRGQLTIRRVCQYALLFLLPFLLADSAWMVRNYRSYRQVIPLLKNAWYPENVFPDNYFDIVAFCQTYGEDFSYWFPNTDSRWLLGWGNNNFVALQQNWFVDEHLGPPPDYIYTKRFNQDSLVQVRQMYYDLGNGPVPTPMHRRHVKQEIKARLGRYTRSVQEDHPLVCYVWAPLRYTYDFLCGTRGYNFLDDIVPATWLRLLLRLYHYIFVLIPGLMGFFLLARRGWRTDYRLLMLPLTILCCILVYAFLVRHAETRYLVPFYPFLVLSAAGAFLTVTPFLTKKITSYGLPLRYSAHLQ